MLINLFCACNALKLAGWERAFETARLAKIPHLLYKEQWEKKQLQVRL